MSPADPTRMTANTHAETVAHTIAHTRAWVDRAVIGLNLCPFAKAVQVRGRVRYAVSAADGLQPANPVEGRCGRLRRPRGLSENATPTPSRCRRTASRRSWRTSGIAWERSTRRRSRRSR